MRVEKVQLFKYVTDLVRDADYIFFISYKGLKVEQFNELRRKLKDQQANCQVLKNTYIKLGLAESDFSGLDSLDLTGDTAMVFGTGDPCAPAKAIKDFGKTSPPVAFKAGILDETVIGAADVAAVADLPPLEVIQAQLLGLLLAPASGLARVLNAKMASIMYVLKAYLDKQSEQA